MLSASEFTVGNLGDAKPLSLILPRTRHEQAILIGQIEGKPAAVFLTGQFAFCCFESEGNTSWQGLIIPDVRMEIDETSLFDPARLDTPFGSIIRSDSRLTILAKRERSFGGGISVTLHDGLVSAGELKAGFSKWEIVVGNGLSRRVLWTQDKSATD